MPDPIFVRPTHRPVPSVIRPRRRFRWLFIIVIAVILAVIIGGRTAVSYYVSALWFGSLGYADVFWKTLRLEWLTFAVFTVATFLILHLAFLALKRTNSSAFSGPRTILIGGQPVNIPVDRILRVITLGFTLLVAIVSGTVMTANWATFALYWYAPSPTAGSIDPIFGKSLGFYLFSLPAWQLVAGWLTVLAVIICLVAGLFLAISGGVSALTRSSDSSLASRWRGLSIPFSFLLLLIALQVYLGRFERLFESHTVFTGVTYTDAHVILPGLLFVCVALILGAGIAATNAFWSPRWRRLVAAVVPALLCYVILQISGWYVNGFVVKPNELVRERPYIENNIKLTRQAFDLQRVSQREFPADTSVEAADPLHNQATIQNIRLWDWRALQDTLRQIQEIRTYYDFPDIDIDRYEIDGATREVMLAARELNIEKLPESSRNWINEKLIYTHGYGITMNPVNGFTPEGLPTLLLSNMPVQTTVPSLSVSRPEIYFGELTNTDVYVKTRQQEFNYPQGQTNSFTSYEGTGGIVIGGFLRRILIAIDRGDLGKLPFSDDVSAQSRLLMRRSIKDRVAALAPFLTFDPDPYIVLDDAGRLSWIMDAFTTSESYPYSSHPGDESINYIRNSVKVVIDAYDGTTTFYVFDKDDPIIAAYRRLFPALFKDASAMSPALRKHVRYPEMLLKLQAQVYGLYHMTDPEVFYNREDLWNVGTEVGTGAGGDQGTRTMEPNFVLMTLPGETGVEFVEILPFTPANRNNLIGWIAGRSDGAQYGTALAYNFPKTKLVDGPMQIEARIDQNAQLSGQLTLWNQQGSHVRRGPLLVIPISRALLYAEGIYLQAERSPMPELRLVVLAVQDRLAYGPTFESALSSLFGQGSSSLTTTAPSPEAAPHAAAPQTAADVNALITQASKDLADYQRLTAEGKLAEAGQKLEHLKHTLDDLNKHVK